MPFGSLIFERASKINDSSTSTSIVSITKSENALNCQISGTLFFFLSNGSWCCTCSAVPTVYGTGISTFSCILIMETSWKHDFLRKFDDIINEKIGVDFIHHPITFYWSILDLLFLYKLDGR